MMPRLVLYNHMVKHKTCSYMAYHIATSHAIFPCGAPYGYMVCHEAGGRPMQASPPPLHNVYHMVAWFPPCSSAGYSVKWCGILYRDMVHHMAMWHTALAYGLSVFHSSMVASALCPLRRFQNHIPNTSLATSVRIT